MEVILGILLLLVIGGIVLRFSRAAKISWWKAALCLLCWIVGGIIVVVNLIDASGSDKWMYLIGIPIVIVLPFVIIGIFQIIGKFLHWALGGWSDD